MSSFNRPPEPTSLPVAPASGAGAGYGRVPARPSEGSHCSERPAVRVVTAPPAGHPRMTIGVNSYIGSGGILREDMAKQMASHLEHLVQVLRDPDAMTHLSRDEQLAYVKFALNEHSRVIVEQPQ